MKLTLWVAIIKVYGFLWWKFAILVKFMVGFPLKPNCICKILHFSEKIDLYSTMVKEKNFYKFSWEKFLIYTVHYCGGIFLSSFVR